MTPISELPLLIIAGDHDDRRYVRQTFSQEASVNLPIRHCPDFETAAKLLVQQSFSAVLLCASSAGVENTLYMLNQILHLAPQLAVLILASASNEELAVTALRQGAQDYLVKGTDDSHHMPQRLVYAMERKSVEQQLLCKVQFDGLTNLPTRALFRDRLSRAIGNAKRNHSGFALLFLDLDDFKSINDSLGHDAGDLLLVQVAKRLRTLLRDSDTVARLGGDEFTIILDDLTNPAYASTIAEKILAVMAHSFVIDGHELFTTTSIGIAIYENDCDENTLLKNADAALYNAKSQGRSTYRFFDSDMNIWASRRLQMVTSLRHAVNRREFLLCYQPQVDLKTGEVIGMEALLRWNNPKLGTISPAQFIPLLEETGLVVEVGKWVLASACKFNKSLQRLGFPPMRVGVNLSPRQFMQTDLPGMVCDILMDSKLHAQYLLLEITENMLVDSVEKAVGILQALQTIGVHLALDDFGTGYSSLNYLKRLPLHCIKLDRSFVQNVNSASQDAAIVKAIIEIGRSMHMQVVAEGVETKEQQHFLETHGCDMAQGYLFGHPMQEKDFVIWLRNHRDRLVEQNRSIGDGTSGG